MLDIIKRGFIETFPTQQTAARYRKVLEQSARSAKPSILLAAMPKSGSTFCSNVLALASGYRKTHFVYGWERNAQDLYLPNLVRCMGVPTVVQQHTVATGPNLELIRIFNLRTIVLVRNLFDVVMSVLDHSVSEDFRGPAGYLTQDYLGFDVQRKIDMIIDSIMPWYIGFYVSWQEARDNDGCPLHFITYEQLITDEVSTIVNALRFCEIQASETDARDAMDAAKLEPRKIRLNKGVSGRGDTGLTAAQKERIVRLTRYYPSIDFSMIGIRTAASGGAARKVG